MPCASWPLMAARPSGPKTLPFVMPPRAIGFGPVADWIAQPFPRPFDPNSNSLAKMASSAAPVTMGSIIWDPEIMGQPRAHPWVRPVDRKGRRQIKPVEKLPPDQAMGMDPKDRRPVKRVDPKDPRLVKRVAHRCLNPWMGGSIYPRHLAIHQTMPQATHQAMPRQSMGSAYGECAGNLPANPAGNPPANPPTNSPQNDLKTAKFKAKIRSKSPGWPQAQVGALPVL